MDIYSSANCDGSGYGEGARWLNSATVTVPQPTSGDQATANFSIAFTLQPLDAIPNNGTITSTATDASGNTSEFSACAYYNDLISANGFE